MFYIYTEGSIKNIKEVIQFSEQVLDYFFPRGVSRDIDILLAFKKHLDGVSGLCNGDRDEACIDIAKGMYDDTGEYLPYDRRHIMHTLAHELVHAKQYFRGELRPNNDGWHGKPVDVSSQSEYANMPWEAQAYKYETILTEMFYRDSV